MTAGAYNNNEGTEDLRLTKCPPEPDDERCNHYDADPMRQKQRTPGIPDRKVLNGVAPPTAAAAAAKLAAARKSNTRCKLSNANGRPNHRSSSQATKMASLALQTRWKTDAQMVCRSCRSDTNRNRRPRTPS